MKIEATVKYRPSPIVTTFGIGNAGVQIVNSLFNQDIHKMNFVVASSDSWSLDRCRVNIQIQLGAILNRGIGTSTSLDFGVGGVFESILEIEQFILNVDLFFIIVGLGGGTGTTGCSVVAELARRANAFVVGIIILPFEFEGEHRRYNSMFGLELFRRIINLAVVIRNERLLQIHLDRVEIEYAFSIINKTIYSIVRGMMTVISKSGVFNVNFCDALLVLRWGGAAYVGYGLGFGYRRSIIAIQKAMVTSFLNSIVFNRARALLITFLAGNSLCLREINNAIYHLVSSINYFAELVVGYGVDERILNGGLEVTIVGTGIDKPLIPCAAKRRNLFFDQSDIVGEFTRPFIGISIYDPQTKLMPVKLLPVIPKLKSSSSDELRRLIILKKKRRRMEIITKQRFRKDLYQCYLL